MSDPRAKLFDLSIKKPAQQIDRPKPMLPAVQIKGVPFFYAWSDLRTLAYAARPDKAGSVSSVLTGDASTQSFEQMPGCTDCTYKVSHPRGGAGALSNCLIA